MSEQEFCIVLTTTNQDTNTDHIIESLLKNQLAACIQTMPIQSHYAWQGEICSDSETLLIIKTKASLYQQVEQKINELHNYDVSQVVQVSIEHGSNPYLAWLDESTK